jgi:uncharacterized membrane protein
MILLTVIQIIVGLALALFIPGYLIVLLFFRELRLLERISLSLVLSICVDIVIGLFLGYNKYMKELTGGITALNLWIYLMLITVWLAAIYVLKKKIMK